MNILALDLATHTGFALLEGGRVESGVVVFDVRRGESPGCRFIKFNRWLDEILLAEDFKPRVALVAYEMPHLRGGAATEVLVGLSTRVVEFCARHSIDHTSVHSATIKQFATHNARASKAQMIAAATEHFGRKIEDDNEADALWLLDYVQHNYIGRDNGITQ